MWWTKHRLENHEIECLCISQTRNRTTAFTNNYKWFSCYLIRMEIKTNLQMMVSTFCNTKGWSHSLWTFYPMPYILSIYTIDCFCSLITNQLHYIGASNLRLYDPPPEPDLDLDGEWDGAWTGDELRISLPRSLILLISSVCSCLKLDQILFLFILQAGKLGLLMDLVLDSSLLWFLS